jgi:hypothetical protein
MIRVAFCRKGSHRVHNLLRNSILDYDIWILLNFLWELTKYNLLKLVIQKSIFIIRTLDEIQGKLELLISSVSKKKKKQLWHRMGVDHCRRITPWNHQHVNASRHGYHLFLSSISKIYFIGKIKLKTLQGIHCIKSIIAEQ